MAGLVTVFDAEGNAILLDHVDARDYLATGRYTSEPVDPEVAKARALADVKARRAAAEIMTAEKDGVDIRQSPLDHDGDGKAGGSLPKAARTKKVG